MARKPVKLPDYFTAEESQDLVDAAPSYPVRMAMRIMLRTGLRVGECLSLRPQDIRLSQDPPITSLRLEMTGNKSKKGREVPMPSGTPTLERPSSTGFPRRVFQQRTTWPGRSAQNSHGLDSERLPRTRRVRVPEAKVSLNRSVRKQPRMRWTRKFGQVAK